MVHVQDTSAVEDKYKLNFILFYCLGTLAQLSSAVLSNSQSYWNYKFRDTVESWDLSRNITTTLQNEFTADFALAGGLPMILGLGFSLLYTRTWDLINRLLVGFCTYILMYSCMILFILIDTDSWQTEFLYLTLGIIVVISSTNGIFLFTILQLAAKFPPVFITGILSGQAVCGIFASSLEILTLLVDGTPITSGVIYFSITLGFYILTMIGLLVLLRYSHFLNHHIWKSENTQTDSKLKINKPLIKETLKKQKYLLASFALIYIITASIHPAITATAESVNNGSRWNDTFFRPVVTFFLYNVFDLLSREIALGTSKPKNNILICMLCVSRIFLVALILMCNLNAKHHIPDVLNSDWAYIILMILFAASNGYMTNNTLLAVHRNYANQDVEKPITIGLIAIAMFIGLVMSSFIGVLLVQII